MGKTCWFMPCWFMPIRVSMDFWDRPTWLKSNRYVNHFVLFAERTCPPDGSRTLTGGRPRLGIAAWNGDLECDRKTEPGQAERPYDLVKADQAVEHEAGEQDQSGIPVGPKQPQGPGAVRR